MCHPALPRRLFSSFAAMLSAEAGAWAWRPGERVQCVVQLDRREEASAQPDVWVDWLVAQCRGALSGGAEDRRVLASQEQVIVAGLRVAPGGLHRFAVSVELPPGAPPTFSGSAFTIAYGLELRLRLMRPPAAGATEWVRGPICTLRLPLRVLSAVRTETEVPAVEEAWPLSCELSCEELSETGPRCADGDAEEPAAEVEGGPEDEESFAPSGVYEVHVDGATLGRVHVPRRCTVGGSVRGRVELPGTTPLGEAARGGDEGVGALGCVELAVGAEVTEYANRAWTPSTEGGGSGDSSGPQLSAGGACGDAGLQPVGRTTLVSRTFSTVHVATVHFALPLPPTLPTPVPSRHVALEWALLFRFTLGHAAPIAAAPIEWRLPVDLLPRPDSKEAPAFAQPARASLTLTPDGLAAEANLIESRDAGSPRRAAPRADEGGGKARAVGTARGEQDDPARAAMEELGFWGLFWAPMSPG